MIRPSPLVRAAVALPCLAIVTAEAIAQQPQLQMAIRDFPPFANTSLTWTLTGRPNDIYGLFVDQSIGSGTVLGVQLELALSPAAILVHAGLAADTVTTHTLLLPPAALPPGMPFFTQAASFDPLQGLDSALVSNVDSFAAHAAPWALTIDFRTGGGFSPFEAGVYDTSVQTRLQALPPSSRLVRTVPPAGAISPSVLVAQPLHPSGSRMQMVLRASDLGTVGVPETLVSVRWRPLFGSVVAETLPQFELIAAATDVVPDYTLDSFSALPMFPQSGLSPQYSSNPAPGSSVTVFSGSYDVSPQDLLPSGYVPFPALQQPFVYDGSRSLLFETRCAPTVAGGLPNNYCVLGLMVFTSPLPFGTVISAPGYMGQPSPVVPQSTPVGFGGSFLFDWQLELRRTTSMARSIWYSAVGNLDYQAPIVASHTPPGTSLHIEYRGGDFGGVNPTAWSTSPDVADGRPMLQFRIVMEADPVTGAVPWIDTLIVPVM